MPRCHTGFRWGIAVLGALATGAAPPSHARPTDSTTPISDAGAAAIVFPHDHVVELEAAVRTLVSNRGLKDAQIGIAVLDVATGHFLATFNEHLPLNPASNAKLYTAGAALAHLHGDHRYVTSISGTPRGDAIQGPLVLRGHGDPSLSTQDLWAMVEELRTRGFRRVDGDVVVDQRFFDEQTTPPAFEQQPNEWASFRAPISAVAVNENTVTLAVRPGETGGAARAWFDPPGYVDVDGTVTTAGAGADNVILELRPNGKRLAAKLSGSIAEVSKLVRYTRRVEDPTLLAGYVLKHLLERQDIKVTGEVKLGHTTSGSTLVRHESEPLSRLLYPVGKDSNNFYAEMVYRSLAGEVHGRPAKTNDASQVVTSWLQGIGAWDAGMAIRNGSGLFDANRVTVASITALLRACWNDSSLQPEFVSQLAVGGIDGTLQRRFRDRSARLNRAVRAKTGTLENAVALSGYVLGPPGRSPVAFSVVINRAVPSQGRAAIDTLVSLLVLRQWGAN